MPKSKINVALLAKVRDHILEEPRRYRQSTWGRRNALVPCGTAACIAGWAANLGGAFTLEELREGPTETGILAQQLLGLTTAEANILFESPHLSRWPERYRVPFNEAWYADDAEAMARIAADYLNHIINTGKVLE